MLSVIEADDVINLGQFKVVNELHAHKAYIHTYIWIDRYIINYQKAHLSSNPS